MTISVVAAGNIGTTLARALVRAARPVWIANSRGAETPHEVVKDARPEDTTLWRARVAGWVAAS